MVAIRRTCPECHESRSPKTIRRHLKYGCPSYQKRASKLRRAVDACLARLRRLGLADPALPLLARYHRPTSPTPSIEDDDDNEAMEPPEPEHPDSQFDTPGAGPGPSSRSQSPRFGLNNQREGENQDEDEDVGLDVLRDLPWMHGLTVREYYEQNVQRELLRGGLQLPDHHRMTVRSFNYKVDTDISGHAYSKLRRAFPDRLDDLPPERELARQIAKISGFAARAIYVEGAKNDADEDRRSRETGINGLSPLARISSLSFPVSFPHDFMHLIFENIIPTLFDLWTRGGNFATFGTGDENYLLHPDVWTVVAEACPLLAQLSQIKLIYGLTEELDLEEHRENIKNGTRYNNYSDLVFVNPTKEIILQPSLQRKVAKHLSGVIGIEEGVISNALEGRHSRVWGKMQRLDRSLAEQVVGGEVIRGAMLTSCESMRDASHVRFYSKFSRWRWDCVRPTELHEEQLSYGRAEMFVVLEADFIASLNIPDPLPIIVAIVSPFVQLRHIRDADLVEYRLSSGNYAGAEVVDATKIDCLIGRITTGTLRRRSFVVERTSVVGRMDMLDVTVEPE
ncbi:unnamed protein product [Rhizoctonia solani]|uniref:Uncharacterized protein n=1 Tax=Rhizoctonia solani TaxID=456999 RepID=A0A8H3BFA7_9AGAM|nr:unnamed protein product [Rhizoctonia solani]